jgi:hypothetical protein
MIQRDLQSEQDFRFPSFPRRRESSKPLKSLDSRLRGNDEFTGLAKVLKRLTGFNQWGL